MFDFSSDIIYFCNRNINIILLMGFFKSFFSGKPDNPMAEQEKARQKNFDIFKYDGLRAQRMGRQDYAIKCFTEALAIHDDFETRNYLAQAYIQTNQLEQAREQLEQMTHLEPAHTSTYLALANVCYMQEDYTAMADAAKKAIELETGNAMAHYLLAKADKGMGDGLMCIAHLTQAITLKEDFDEARLLRAEALIHMQQYNEAQEDISAILAQDPDEENALLLRGQIAEANRNMEQAEADYRRVTEVNPFNEQAYLYLSRLYTARHQLAEAISLLDEAIELNPNSPALYHERGRAKLLNNDKDGSVEDLKKELELNPQEAEALNGEYKNKPLVQTGNILGL